MLVRLFVLAVAASAATIKIKVGQGGLTYTPDAVTAAIGDLLEFQFVGGTHDVVRGDFSKPCQPGPSAADGGFASGVQQGSPTNVSRLEVAAKPLLTASTFYRTKYSRSP